MQYTLPLEPVFKKVVKKDGMVFLLIEAMAESTLEKYIRNNALNHELVLGFADPATMKIFNNRNYLQHRIDAHHYLYNLMYHSKDYVSIYLVFRNEHNSVLFKLQAEGLELKC